MADSPKPKKVGADLEALIKAALQNEQVPKIYANGFGLGLSNSDIFIVFQRFGPNPVGVVNLSYTLAKTLAQKLGAMVAEFEVAIGGQEILTTDRIDEIVSKTGAEPPPNSAEANAAKSKADEVH